MAALAAPTRARAQQPTQKAPATIPQATIPQATIPKATIPKATIHQDTTARARTTRAATPQGGARPRGVRRVQTLEIRAQVPVPQVVTVRPRLVPAFRAAALDSAFVDEHFWTALRTPYQAVPMMSPPSSPSSLLNVPPKER
jgi:hypothetical protein